jgi:hypothetical protein
MVINDLTVYARNDMYWQEIQGVVVSNENGRLHIEGESLTGGQNEAVVYISGATVYDLLTGYPVRSRDIREGTAAQMSFHGDYAFEVWLNCHEEYAAAFKAIASENIQYTADSCVFLTIDGKYRVYLTPDTYIIDPFAGAITPLDVFPGHEMFIWVDMVTASSPALAFPQKAVLIY